MNPKKTKEKERRRARKLAEEAWEAAHDQNLDLAEKIIRRAVTTQIDNPVLWNDQGMILALRGKEMEAEESFRSAISLALTYAEPFAHLAAMRAKEGRIYDAVRFMEQAVEHAPETAQYVERLAAYRALADTMREPVHDAASVDAPVVLPLPEQRKRTTEIVSLNWDDLGERLTQEGCVLVPALLDAGTCTDLRVMFDDDTLFAKTVVMNREDFGQGVYRYFKSAIPEVVDELRRSMYPYVAKVANEWQGLLNKAERFPDEWEGFRLRCQEAGQTTPTPILLKYGPGGFNALHRDLRGDVYFPIQLAVVLSPVMGSSEPDGFCGGEFLFCDVPEDKKSRQREIPAGLGDAILFCTRDRLVRVGGACGLQPVKHGVNPITRGSRLVLGVPFHEYR